MDAVTENTDTLLVYRVAKLEEAVGEIRNAIKSIDACLKVFAVIEAKQASIHDTIKTSNAWIDAVDKRLQTVEIEIPTIKLARNWIIGGVSSIAIMAGSSVLAMVLR